MDFNGDGNQDIISGCYDPGTLHLIRGLGKGEYAAVETINDKDGKPILSNPDQKQAFESFGSWVAAVDWDNDDDLDLLLGTYSGGLLLRLNEGTRGEPQYASENVTVEVGDKPAQVPGAHFTPTVADWDGDGLWDILTGSENGGVYWLRNTGKLGSPEFAEMKCIVPAHEGIGYDERMTLGQEPRPGIRSQIFATDYNGDGKVDLLLGDFCTNVVLRDDLTNADREAMAEIEMRGKKLGEILSKMFEDLRREFAEKYPGNAITTDEATKEWSEKYQEMRTSKEYMSTQKQSEELQEEFQKYLVKPDKPGSFNAYSTCHGYVWLYLRK